MTTSMSCNQCGAIFTDGIDAGNHEIDTGHRVEWDNDHERRRRYITTTVSVGAAGLTSRPAVWDRTRQRIVHTYRAGEEQLAGQMAEKLNAEAADELEPDSPAARLEYLRGELRAERISYGELAELQELAPHIAPDDVELLEAAGVPERAGDEHDIPADWPVQPIAPNDPHAIRATTCGTCGRTWDDGKVTSMTPTPSARCPFEWFHADELDAS